jgi:hypothetical protein
VPGLSREPSTETLTALGATPVAADAESQPSPPSYGVAKKLNPAGLLLTLNDCAGGAVPLVVCEKLSEDTLAEIVPDGTTSCTGIL